MSDKEDEDATRGGVTRQLHELERRFQMSAHEILDVALSSNRTLMNLKGAIAQEHLRRHLAELKRRSQIEDYEGIDRDGQPDFWVLYSRRRILIECKNVQQNKTKHLNAPMTVDFWRTRNQSATGQTYGRYYAEGEFDVLAACLFNRTGQWTFQFIDVNRLPRLAEDPKRFQHRILVGAHAPAYGPYWSDDLLAVLDRIAEQK